MRLDQCTPDSLSQSMRTFRGILEGMSGAECYRYRRACVDVLSRRLFVVAVVTGVIAVALASDMKDNDEYIPRIEKRYTMHLEELQESLDELGMSPTLVSTAEYASLFLPLKPHRNATTFVPEGDDEEQELRDDASRLLTFTEDFEPMWYYVLRRRGFSSLEWSGCGGRWRPEWSLPHADYESENASGSANERATQTFSQLRHFLSHHVVCSFSSISACARSKTRGTDAHFQWAAQFISMLTSSPLSWTADTPRHTRPSGLLLEGATPQTSATSQQHAGGESKNISSWCSYHVVYHDTLCTQHVSPLLSHGRFSHGIQEGLPDGIFKASISSFYQLFATPFHHFTIRATQHYHRDRGLLEVRLRTRLSFVAWGPNDFSVLRDVWRSELPKYATDPERLRIYIGRGGLNVSLMAALPPHCIVDAPSQIDLSSSAQGTRSDNTTKSISLEEETGLAARQPRVQYTVQAQGKDHGYYAVTLQPSLRLMGHVDPLSARMHRAPSNVDWSSSLIQAGGVVTSLLLFPLHTIRPELHSMESLGGGSVIEAAHVDTSSNTLAVLLRTKLTKAHVERYRRAYDRASEQLQIGREFKPERHIADEEGVLLARFRFMYGWSALKEMPPDANSYRILPQPIVRIDYTSGEIYNTSHCTAIFREESAELLDHQESISSIMDRLGAPLNGHDQRICSYWLRSSSVAGTTIPVPDAPMVFNVLSLGLLASSMAVCCIARQFNKLYVDKDLSLEDNVAVGSGKEKRA